MSTDPYAAPTANLDNNIDAAPIQSSIWKAKGRLSVLSYLAHSLVLMLVGMIFFGVLFAIGTAMGASGGMPASLESMESIDFSSPVILILGILAVVLYVIFLYITICMMIKRLHDRNHSGWWSLALFVGLLIPFVNIVAIIALLYVVFWPGQKQGNRFGGRRHTKGWEKILGIIYVVLILGSILAAIAGGAAMFMNVG